MKLIVTALAAAALASAASAGKPTAAAPTSASRNRLRTNAARIDAPGILNVHVIPHTHDDVGKWLTAGVGVIRAWGGLHAGTAPLLTPRPHPAQPTHTPINQPQGMQKTV